MSHIPIYYDSISEEIKFISDSGSFVDEEELKSKINGEGLIDRLKYRKSVGLINIGKKAIVQKGQKLIIETQEASKLAAEH